ncbi:MAG: hypothetical protein EHM59_15065 [Betaproteobacteria bacterium]|nr:MAG: hypothetical protein EHM59_15065 [Betaproteobacteria bacterium]
MRSYEEALKLLLALSSEMTKLNRTRKEYLNSGLNAADKAEKVDRLDDQLAQVERERIDVLQDLVLFPPHHLQYAQLLEQFNQTLNGQGKPYERRVFIMTKYCDGANAQLDSQLEAVIGTVKAAVVARGYHPQLAAETKLHPNLWENIECQMLACGRGIAIVEDRFNPKLNPNVAMEWGWMRAMKKPVLYLVEKAVAQVPADVAGLIQGRFDWDNPQANIPQLVAQDLP